MIVSGQKYEDYWSITLEYTDIHGKKFLDTLKIIVDKIDELNRNGNYVYNKNDYQDLQNTIQSKFRKNAISTRKAINQFIKLGFVSPKFKSYHHLTKEFLDAKNSENRKIIFSNIVYDNSNFKRSVNHESDLCHLNFLIKTLTENGSLTKSEIAALMRVDIVKIKKGFLNKAELQQYCKVYKKEKFIIRKYNQIKYLYNILGKLEGIQFVGDTLYFKEDASKISQTLPQTKTTQRDAYMHRLYKESLLVESQQHYRNKIVCYLHKLSYPSLIASHIKPFIESDDSEKYDPNNGLLLSRTLDYLFDKYYISFKDDGTLIFSKKLSNDVKKSLKDYSLDKHILNSKRLKYLSYHRQLLEEKDNSDIIEIDMN